MASYPQAPVDARFPVSVAARTMGTKDTTQQVGPRAMALERRSRAWPIELRTRPTMTNVDARADIRPAQCPTCGRDEANVGLTAHRGVFTKNYLCPVGHLWLIKWPAVA